MFFYKKKRKIINIEGMLSDMDQIKLETTLKNLIDVSKVKVDLIKKQVIVTYEHTLDDILLQDTIEKLGYIVTGIKEAV